MPIPSRHRPPGWRRRSPRCCRQPWRGRSIHEPRRLWVWLPTAEDAPYPPQNWGSCWAAETPERFAWRPWRVAALASADPLLLLKELHFQCHTPRGSAAPGQRPALLAPLQSGRAGPGAAPGLPAGHLSLGGAAQARRDPGASRRHRPCASPPAGCPSPPTTRRCIAEFAPAMPGLCRSLERRRPLPRRKRRLPTIPPAPAGCRRPCCAASPSRPTSIWWPGRGFRRRPSRRSTGPSSAGPCSAAPPVPTADAPDLETWQHWERWRRRLEGGQGPGRAPARFSLAGGPAGPAGRLVPGVVGRVAARPRLSVAPGRLLGAGRSGPGRGQPPSGRRAGPAAPAPGRPGGAGGAGPVGRPGDRAPGGDRPGPRPGPGRSCGSTPGCWRRAATGCWYRPGGPRRGGAAPACDCGRAARASRSPAATAAPSPSPRWSSIPTSWPSGVRRSAPRNGPPCSPPSPSWCCSAASGCRSTAPAWRRCCACWSNPASARCRLRSCCSGPPGPRRKGSIWPATRP